MDKKKTTNNNEEIKKELATSNKEKEVKNSKSTVRNTQNNNQRQRNTKKAKLTSPVSKFKVSNDKLIEILSSRQVTMSELKKIGVTEYQLNQLKSLNFKLQYQYDPTEKDFVYYIIEKGHDPFMFLPDNGEETLKIAKMGDLHIGSNETDEAELISLLSYLWEKGYRIISMSGDLIDGAGVYRGQTENLNYATIDMQVDVAVSILSMFDFLYITNKGNHDASSTKNGGVDGISLVQEKMINRGKKFVYLKSYCGYIIYKDTAIQLLHMDGGNSVQSDTYANQKVVDAMHKTSSNRGKANVNCISVFGRMVPVVDLITGHYHTLVKFMYGNMVVESPLTAQHTTDLINRRGIRSKTGARVSEMKIVDGKCISERGAIIFGRDVEEIYSLEKASGLLKTVGAPKVSKMPKNQSIIHNDNVIIDIDKINKAIKKLSQKGFYNKKELGLTNAEIKYINQQCNYNIYVEKDVVVFKTENDSNTIIYSPIEQKGIVSYLEISNILVGSKFFSEDALRYMLDMTRARGVKYVHIGGNAIWGIPKKHNAQNTRLFKGHEQVDKLVEILKDYPEFHYFTINGACENTFISSKDDEIRFDPMRDVEQKMQALGIKFTAVNSYKCDFLIYGIVFRMANNKSAMKNPYTIDYDIVKEQRNLMAKQGNMIRINGNQYSIGAIYYGSVPSTIETYSGGMYITSTAGPTIDPDNVSRIIRANPEAAIVEALVDHGEILKFEREVLSPNIIV